MLSRCRGAFGGVEVVDCSVGVSLSSGYFLSRSASITFPEVKQEYTLLGESGRLDGAVSLNRCCRAFAATNGMR